MNTPPPPPTPPPAYTVTKLLRWRVKVLVSCFYTCNFPLEEETESNNRQVPRETASMKSKVGKKTKQKGKKEAKSSSSSRLIRRRRVVAENKEIGGVDEAFGDDDFIVFCFRDDGEVQVVLPETNTTSNPILSTHDHFQPLRLENEAVGNEKACNQKVQGKEASIREKTEEREEEGSGEDKEISTASSDSNDQSDASTASFAFPIIQEKWIGSPVEMPRSGVRRPKINTRIHCCRF